MTINMFKVYQLTYNEETSSMKGLECIPLTNTAKHNIFYYPPARHAQRIGHWA